MKNQKSMGNKGFSLVELIIVIAIMAILIAVLAPQYLKYVEKSRFSADQQTASEFVDALQVACSDVDISATLDNSKTYKVESAASTGVITISGDAKTILGNYMDANAAYKYQSQAFKAQATSIELEYDATNKVWTVKKTAIPAAQ